MIDDHFHPFPINDSINSIDDWWPIPLMSMGSNSNQIFDKKIEFKGEQKHVPFGLNKEVTTHRVHVPTIPTVNGDRHNTSDESDEATDSKQVETRNHGLHKLNTKYLSTWDLELESPL